MKEFSNLHIVNHPLLEAKVNEMRNKDASSDSFRRSMEAASIMLAYEASRDMPTIRRDIDTPFRHVHGELLCERNVMLVPVLRGGLCMIEPLFKLFCCAEVGGLGIYHNPRTMRPELYLQDFRHSLEHMTVYILDPVVASGRSAVTAVDCVKGHGAKRIKCLYMVGAPEGMERLCSAHPDVEVYLGHLDDGLDDNGNVVPGLGDAGSRAFCTH